MRPSSIVKLAVVVIVAIVAVSFLSRPLFLIGPNDDSFDVQVSDDSGDIFYVTTLHGHVQLQNIEFNPGDTITATGHVTSSDDRPTVPHATNWEINGIEYAYAWFVNGQSQGAVENPITQTITGHDQTATFPAEDCSLTLQAGDELQVRLYLKIHVDSDQGTIFMAKTVAVYVANIVDPGGGSGGGASLEGTVLDQSGSHPPVSGASVKIAMASIEQITTTAADGTFSFTGLSAGTYNLIVTKSGYQIYTDPVTLENQTTRQKTLYLVPSGSTPDPSGTGSIYGNVTDKATGLPIADATVSLDDYDATTDASGNYALNSVPAGDYNMVVKAHGYTAYAGTVTITDGSSDRINIELSTQILSATVILLLIVLFVLALVVGIVPTLSGFRLPTIAVLLAIFGFLIWLASTGSLVLLGG